MSEREGGPCQPCHSETVDIPNHSRHAGTGSIYSDLFDVARGRVVRGGDRISQSLPIL